MYVLTSTLCVAVPLAFSRRHSRYANRTTRYLLLDTDTSHWKSNPEIDIYLCGDSSCLCRQLVTSAELQPVRWAAGRKMHRFLSGGRLSENVMSALRIGSDSWLKTRLVGFWVGSTRWYVPTNWPVTMRQRRAMSTVDSSGRPRVVARSREVRRNYLVKQQCFHGFGFLCWEKWLFIKHIHFTPEIINKIFPEIWQPCMSSTIKL